MTDTTSSQNFIQRDHPFIDTILPSAINAGIGLAFGVNPLAVGLKTVSNGINAFQAGRKYDNAYNAFKSQRQDIQDILPAPLKDMAKTATSYDRLNDIAKNYYPMVQGQNSINDYNKIYAPALGNNTLNQFGDPTQAHNITSDLSKNYFDMLKQGSTSDFMGARNQGLSQPQTQSQTQPQTPQTNAQPYQETKIPDFVNNPNIPLEQKKQMLAQYNNNSTEPNTNTTPANYTQPSSILQGNANRNEIEPGSMNPFNYVAQNRVYNDAVKEGYKYNPQINPDAGLQVAKTTGQNIENQYMPRKLESEINHTNTETQYIPYNAQTGRMNAETGRMNSGSRSNAADAKMQEKLANLQNLNQDLQDFNGMLNTVPDNQTGRLYSARVAGNKLHRNMFGLSTNEQAFQTSRNNLKFRIITALDDAGKRVTNVEMNQIDQALPSLDMSYPQRVSAYTQLNRLIKNKYGINLGTMQSVPNNTQTQSAKPTITRDEAIAELKRRGKL